MAKATLTTTYRWHVASRVFAAVLLGYLLTNTVGTLLALALPVSRVGGLVTGTVLSFLLWSVVIMWVFAVDRLRTVWLGLTAAVIVSGLGAWGLYLLRGTP